MIRPYKLTRIIFKWLDNEYSWRGKLLGTTSYFDHIEILGPTEEVRMMTRTDIKRSYGMFKAFTLFLLFVASWFFLMAYKLLAVLILSPFALALNTLLKRNLTYGRIFLLCALIQSWVLVVDMLRPLLPMINRIGGLLTWFVSLTFLAIVFHRFLVPQSENLPSPDSPTTP